MEKEEAKPTLMPASSDRACQGSSANLVGRVYYGLNASLGESGCP